MFSKLCKIEIGIQSAELLTKILRSRILYNDEFAMGYTAVALLGTLAEKQEPYEALFAAFDRLTNVGHERTFCSDFVIRYVCSLVSTFKCFHYVQQGNKSVYFYMRLLDKNSFRTDIASCKLRLSTFLLQMRDYCGSLRIINYVLSSVPPYAQYCSLRINLSNDLSQQLYVDTFYTHNSNIIKRAKEAWLNDLCFTQEEHPFLPRAIQVELAYCHEVVGVRLSPFAYAYYLMFMCYHGLR